MSNRRLFINKSFTTLASISLLPALNSFGIETSLETNNKLVKHKLRFALVSDGHFGQSNTPYIENYNNMVKWINQEHKTNRLDFVIVNGDIVHDRPDLLETVNRQHFSKFNRS